MLQSLKHFNGCQKRRKNRTANSKQTFFRCFMCPKGFYIKPLAHKDTLFIIKNYKHAISPFVRKRLLVLTSLGKSVGIFEKKTDELTSRAFLDFFFAKFSFQCFKYVTFDSCDVSTKHSIRVMYQQNKILFELLYASISTFSKRINSNDLPKNALAFAIFLCRVVAYNSRVKYSSKVKFYQGFES